ncbi:2-C-methyl-D-erythritol 2,4-cyclodiphosphate synthase [Fuerstiella marisgermanici]|uniref:2-C-methyl-D-erythritol 2,4-cyclodiphosphate synthase n=2 Tax=Fuerstiella marisgermanici TaxID=1891926 RepID=A0A1P8WRA7_9PLAN|nr:2-C-methyl-D-erythritol 2,4-cyclodiphosphate synthase [Fuerstiella marisgermanici]
MARRRLWSTPDLQIQSPSAEWSGTKRQASRKDEHNMQNLPEFRVGEGCDVHRTIADRPLILGGVTVDCDFGLDGHSDADVLLHAIIDAMLGATGQGDIGEWFPNTDAKWKNADSVNLIQHVWNSLISGGWQLQNLDCTICCERPRLGPWKPLIRQRLAEILDVPEDRINVKAKSGEAVGPVGRGEAITAQAVVLLAKSPKNGV